MLKFALMLLVVASLAACESKPPTPNEPPPAVTQGAQPEEEAPAEAEDEEGVWVGDDTYGVKFRVPDDWKVVTGEKSISVTSPEESITILMLGTDGGGVLTAAINSIKEEVSFKDVKLENDKAVVINGLPGQSAAGTAVQVMEEGDQEIQFLMNAVKVGEKGVALMAFAEAEMYEARLEEVDGIMKTLQAR